MRKRTLLFLISVFLLCAYFTRDALLSSGFQWYLKSYCGTCLGGKLSYDEISYKEGKWLLGGAVLATQKSVEEGGYRLEAKAAVITASLDFFKRTLNCALSIESLTGNVGNNSEELKKAALLRSSRYRPVHLILDLDIPNAQITLHEAGMAPAKPQLLHIGFSLQKRQQDTQLQISFPKSSHDAPKKPELLLTHVIEPAPKLSCSFAELDLAKLSKAMHAVMGKNTPLEILQGTVNGDIDLSYSANGELVAEGGLDLSQLSLYQPKQHCSIQVPLLSMLFLSQTDGSASGKTMMQAEISQKAAVYFFHHEQPFWMIKGVTGRVTIGNDGITKLALEGTCVNQESANSLKLDGEFNFAKKEGKNLSLSLLLQNADIAGIAGDCSALHLSMHEIGDRWTFGEIDLSGFNHNQFHLVQNLLKHHFPWLALASVDCGTIDAGVSFYLEGTELTEVNVDHFAVHGLQFNFAHFSPYAFFGKVEDASGALFFNLGDQMPLRTVNAEIAIKEGSVAYSNAPGQPHNQLSQVNAHLSIHRGIIQKSEIRGVFAGLKANIDLDAAAHSCIRISLDGKTGDIAHLLPSFFCPAFEKLPNEEIKIFAEAGVFSEDSLSNFANNDARGFLINGYLLLDPAAKKHAAYKIPFGFRMEMASQLESQIPCSPLEITSGWFEAELLPLDKYLSPLVFQKGQMQLSGLGNFKGAFDAQGIAVRYDAKDLVLESEDFCIDVPSLPSFSEIEAAPPQGLAMHYFDLQEQRSYGTLPIRNGKYFEKNSGLLFTDVHTQIALEDSALHARSLEGFSNGIFFAGNIDVDWSEPGEGVFDLDVAIADMHAKFSQVQQLFSHFKQFPFFLKLPLEANLSLHPNGGLIHFGFTKDDYTIQSHFDGELADGVLDCHLDDLSLQELGLNFKYDHGFHLLEFTGIQATLLIGGANHTEEYAVESDRICFTDIGKNESEFDIWLQDKKRDILRIAGKTSSVFDQWGRSVIDFHFDQARCHFGEVHPTVFQMTLKDWLQMESLRLEFSFSLAALLEELQRFNRSGLLFLSRPMLKGLPDLQKVSGDFNAELIYDGSRSLFSYHLEGNEIAIGNNKFHRFMLAGNKKEAVWSIEQILLDDLSLALDFQKQANLWRIDFLGVRYGHSFLLGMEGHYDASGARLESKINLLEMDLEKMKEWPALSLLVADYQLAGLVHASGHVLLQMDKAWLKEGMLELQLNASIRKGSVKGLHLQDMENIHLKYVSGAELTVNNVCTDIKLGEKQDAIASLRFETTRFDPKQREISFDEIKFTVPAAHLKIIAQQLCEAAPMLFPAIALDAVSCLQPSRELSGGIKLHLSNSAWRVHLRLDDGLYRFFEEAYDVRHFSLDYDQSVLCANFDCLYRRHPIHVSLFTQTPLFEKGELLCIHSADKETSGKQLAGTSPQPLRVHWRIDPKNGCCIEKMEGALCGLHFNLARDPHQPLTADVLALNGTIEMDLKRLPPLLESSLAAKLMQWEAGEGYALKGLWKVRKNLCTQSLFNSLSFQGEGVGQDFKLYGYRFNKMRGDLVYANDQIHLQNLKIEDPSGTLLIDKAVIFNEGDGRWQTVIPQLSVKNFRPYFLTHIGGAAKSSDKALVIRQLELHNVQGTLGKRESITASGSLFFSHSQKQQVHHPIFAIPAEILARIGLDLAVLNPVRGRIQFHIAESKLYLDKFKDVYSKGRMSKFYLADNGYQSYLDFDGNLHMQVRMKQYNLLFKLAELFTVSVQGTWKKPTFTLQKQREEEHGFTASSK
jgi:hypothetical protein